MYPQSELDNYKLQVELLHEKLKNSEERRQQLEEKFENVMRKRKEHERMHRAKNRLKHEQFLREQSERNERNRSLVRALERIDQQASTLAARSERLKILKVQYELYFDKILQFRTMRNVLFNYNNYAHPTIPFAAHPSHHHSTDFDTPAIRREFALTPNVLDDGYHESMSELDSYRRRHDDTITMPRDTIVSSPGAILHRYPQQQRGEVNLRPNVKDVIATSTASTVAGISSSDPYNQSALFADTRISIDSNRYWSEEDPKAIEFRLGGSHGGDGGMNSRPNIAILKSDRPRSPAENRFKDEHSIQTHGFDGSYSHERDRTNLSPAIEKAPQPTGDEQSPTVNIPRQPFTLDKLHAINRDEALGKLLAKLYDKGGKEDDEIAMERSGEKSPSKTTVEGKNMSAMKDEIMDAIESQSTEKVIDNNTSSGKDVDEGNTVTGIPSIHSSRLEKSAKDHFSNSIKKREKLSIETIENAIYGERITPTPSLGDGKLNLDRLRQTLSENLKIDSGESAGEMSSHEGKADESVAIVNEEYGGSPKLELIDDGNRIADEQRPAENPAFEVFNQAPVEAYNSNESDPDSVKAIEQGYEVDSNETANYNSGQYEAETTIYPEGGQYGYEQGEQEQVYPEYGYDQNQEQTQQIYDASQNPEQMYYQTGQEGANYDMSQDMSYQQYPDGNYETNQGQYDANGQSYVNDYPVSEYDPNMQAQGSAEHAPDTAYTYEQQPDMNYDPNSQQEQQFYPETSQDYYQYNDPSQYGDAEFAQQPGEYVEPATVNLESGPLESLAPQDDIQLQQPEDAPTPDATASQPSEQTLMEETTTASTDSQPEPVKPTSILAGSEKSNESASNAGKTKKKKRVIFAENETEESAPNGGAAAQKGDQQGTGGRSGNSTTGAK